VDAVSLTVCEELDLDVTRVVEESLDEDGTVTESALGFTDRTFKVLLEGGLIAYDTHTTSTTTHGRLDDDGETVLLDKVMSEVE
jgi:hypothetical protein